MNSNSKLIIKSVCVTILCWAAGLWVLSLLSLSWAVSMATTTALLIGLEYLYAQQGKKMILRLFVTARDKIVFFASLFIYWTLSLLSQFITNDGLLSKLSLLFGIILAILVFSIFASKEAKRQLTSR